MRTVLALLLALAASSAFAHPGHGGDASGFTAGFLHPFSGLDHLLAMLAVGLWSATTTKRIWLAPLSFASMLLMGALFAAGGLDLPAVEPMIAASVCVLGLLVMTQANLPDAAAAALVAAFALFHGAAHGHELGASLALTGMVCATALLHAIGIFIGLAFDARNLWWRRGVGAAIAMTGLGLAFNLV